MARTIGTKKAKDRKEEPGINTAGKLDYSELIKTTLEDFAISQSMQMAAFFTGKGNDAKTAAQAQSKASQAQPSILGKTNSIYQTLQSLRQSLSKSLSINSKGLGGTIKSINDTIKNALYDKDISLMQALTGFLSTKNESIIKFDEDQLKDLKETIEDKHLTDIMQKVVTAENQAAIALKMAQSYYESFNNTALKNESNIQKIIDAFTNSNQNLANINEEIRKDNENKIAEAKLRLIIEGIDNSTINALVAFSNIDLNNLDKNANSLIIFFESLKVLENTKLNESLVNLNMLGPILVGFIAQIKVVNLIGKIIKPQDIDNFVKILNSFSKIFEELNNLSALSGQANAKQILKSFGVLQETLGLLMSSIPLFLMVNTMYASENGNFGVNIGKTVEVLTDISVLFQYIVNMPQLNNGGKLLKSFGILVETLGLLTYSIPLFIAVNKMYASQNGNSGINIGKTVEVLTDISVLFQKIIDMPQINNGGKLLKSFILLNLINTSLVSSIPSMMLVNQTLSNKDYIKRLQTIFEKIKPLFKAINEAKTIEQGKQLIKSFNQLDKINFSLNNSINEINKIFNNNDLNGDNLKKLKNLYKNEEESDIYSLFIIIDSLNTIKNSSKIIQSFDDFNIINLRLETTLKNIQQLDIKSNKTETEFETIIKSLTYISQIFDIINDIKALNNKTKEKIATIAGLFGSESDKINVSLMKIFKNINQMEFPEQSNLTTITNSLNDIKTIVESLNALGLLAKNAKTINKNLGEYIKLLEDTYKKINEKFELIIATGDTAEKIKAANEKIGEALDSTNETIVKTSNNEKTIEKSVIAIEGITEFMIGAAAVMSIGALFVLLGGGKFIKAALQFGLALAVFEGLVLMPALMFNSQKETALKGIEGFNSFVITCSLTMAIGALIFELGGGKFVKDALAFGLTLSIFEMLVIAPVLSFYVLKDKLLEAMADFNKFIITCTLVMAIGALVIELSNGKFIMNALKFGVALGIFEMLVIAPFILFSLVKDKVNDSVKNFTTLIITCAIIMSIGALFAQNEKFKNGAYDFALLMMKFEVAVIVPFLIFDLLKKQVFDGLKSFGTVVIVCTTVLLIGAMFMHFGGGKFAKNAILFTGVLALFELLIIAPFILFNKVQTTVFGGLKNFAVVVFVATTVLITGALFMTLGNGKYAIAAMEFAGLLMLFEAAVITPLLLFNLVKDKALNGARDFGAFVAMCSFSLLIGAFFIHEYTSKPIEEFAETLGWFTLEMSVLAILMSKLGQKGIEAAKDFSVFILISAATLIIGGIFMTIQNGKYAQGAKDFAWLLGLFVGAMGLVMVGLAWGFKAAGGEATIIGQMAALGTFLLLATASIALGAKIIDKYGLEKPLEFAGLLVGFIGLMGLVFIGLTFIGTLVAPGAAVAALMGVALLALTGSIMLINKIFEKDPEGQKTQKNIEALIGVLDGTKWTFAKLGALGILIAPGAVVAAAIGASLLVLGGAFRVLDIIFGDEGTDIKGNIQFLNDLLKNDLMGTYTILGLLSVPIAAGAIVATAIGVSMLVVGGAFELINLMMGEHGEETKANILILDNILGEVGKTYTILGALSPLIVLGSAAGTLMGISITIIGGALALVNKFIDPIKDNLEDNINKIDTAINSFGSITGTLLKWSIPLTLSLLALPQLVLFTTGVSKSIVSIKTAVDAIKKTGDISKYTQLMTSNIQNFIDIIDNVDGIGMLSGKKSKIREIQSLVRPLGETLGQLAESVQNIAALKIPIEWNEKGKAIKYRNISAADFKLVNDNVNKILVTTAFAFTLAWNMGLKNIANDKNGGFWKAMYFATNVGKILSGITDSVIKISQSMMPDPTSWDPETGKFKKYQKIDFDKASTDLSIVVSKVLFATADAFIRAYNGDGKTLGIKWLIFGNPKQSPFLQAVDGITKMTQTLSSITDSVIKIASAQIPNKWDKDGKVLSYEKINVDESVTNIRKVLLGNGTTPGIITTLIDVYSEAAKSILFNPFLMDQKFFKKINDNLNTIIGLVSKSSDLIVKISSLNIPTKFDKDGKGQEFVKLKPSDIDDAKANMIKILTNLISVFDSTDQSNELNKYLTQVVINPTNINKNIKSIENILPNITKQIQSLIDFNKQTQNIKISNNKDRITSISNLYDGIISIITTIYDKIHNKTSLESKNIGTLSVDISKITNAISTIFSSMGSIYNEFYKNVNKYKTNISSIIDQLKLSDNGLNISVQNLKTNLDAIKALYTQEFSDINFDDKTVLDSLSADLKGFIDNTITPFDNDIFTKATNLHTSINSIYKSLAQQQDKSKEFNKNTNALQTYIKAINTVELNKLKPLTTLVQELNKLANKLGNLDKLTSTISNELSEVLRDLVDSLSEAKTTINNAHQLQSDRAEQIQKSITKVKELINSPLNINVMASTPDSNTTLINNEEYNNTSSPNTSNSNFDTSGNQTKSNETSSKTSRGTRGQANGSKQKNEVT